LPVKLTVYVPEPAELALLTLVKDAEETVVASVV
jgi:hypothetical protein